MHAWVSPFAVGEAIQGAGYSDIYIGQGFNCTGQEYGLSECTSTMPLTTAVGGKWLVLGAHKVSCLWHAT